MPGEAGRERRPAQRGTREREVRTHAARRRRHAAHADAGAGGGAQRHSRVASGRSPKHKPHHSRTSELARSVSRHSALLAHRLPTPPMHIPTPDSERQPHSGAACNRPHRILTTACEIGPGRCRSENSGRPLLNDMGCRTITDLLAHMLPLCNYICGLSSRFHRRGTEPQAIATFASVTPAEDPTAQVTETTTTRRTRCARAPIVAALCGLESSTERGTP